MLYSSTHLNPQPQRTPGLGHGLPAAAGGRQDAERLQALRGCSRQLAGDHSSHAVADDVEAAPAQVIHHLQGNRWKGQ